MTAPVGTHIPISLKSMRNTMVEFCLIRITLSVRLADAFRNDLRIAFLMTHVLAIRTLHTNRVL